MVDTYKQIAERARMVTGRAPKFNVKYFNRREVKHAIENNKFFSHACMELGLMRVGSKSPFHALTNMYKLIDHYSLKHIKLGGKMVDKELIECPHCGGEFKINLDIK